MSPDNIATAIRDIAESMAAVEDGEAGVRHGREALRRLADRIQTARDDDGTRETYGRASADELTPDRRIRGR